MIYDKIENINQEVIINTPQTKKIINKDDTSLIFLSVLLNTLQ